MYDTYEEKKALCDLYGMKCTGIFSWTNYERAARKACLSIEEYFALKKKEIDSFTNIENEEDKIRLCKSFNMPYKDFHSWILYVRRAKQYGYHSVEEYFKSIKDQEMAKQEIKTQKAKEKQAIMDEEGRKRLLVESYGFEYVDGRTYGNYVRQAEKYGMKLEDFLQKKREEENRKIEDEKKILEFCESYQITRDSFHHSLVNARIQGFQTDNSIQDVLNLWSAINKANLAKEVEKYEFQSQKDQCMISLGFEPYQWKGKLVQARKLGFNTEDPFQDIIDCNSYLDGISKELLYEYGVSAQRWIIKYSCMIEQLYDSFTSLPDVKKLRTSCGVYMWRINGLWYYIGESTNLLCRLCKHMYDIYNSPEYWANCIENGYYLSLYVLELETEKIEHDLLKKCLKEIESIMIKTFKPLLQSGQNDHVIHLEERLEIYELIENNRDFRPNKPTDEWMVTNWKFKGTDKITIRLGDEEKEIEVQELENYLQ